MGECIDTVTPYFRFPLETIVVLEIDRNIRVKIVFLISKDHFIIQ